MEQMFIHSVEDHAVDCNDDTDDNSVWDLMKSIIRPEIDCLACDVLYFGEEPCSVDGCVTWLLPNLLLQHQGLKVNSKIERKSLSIHKETHFKCLRCCLVIFCLLSVVDSSFVEVPNNEVVTKSNSTVTIDMACKSDCQCELQWSMRKSHDSVKEKLFNGYFLHPNAKSYCTVKTDEPGKCYLQLTNTEVAAQTYICLEPGTLAEASADLIWLDDLVCNESSTEDLVNLTCSVEFRGHWAPTMEWKEHSSQGEKVLSVGVYTDTIPNQRVTSALILALQDGRINYTCTMKFDISGKPPQTTATNIPEYTYSVIVKQQDKLGSPTEGKESNKVLILCLTLTFVAVTLIIVIVFNRKSIKKQMKNRLDLMRKQLHNLCIDGQFIRNHQSDYV